MSVNPHLIASIINEPFLMSGHGVLKYAPSLGRLINGESFFDKDQLRLWHRKAEVVGLRSNDPEWEEFSYYLHGITPTGQRLKVNSYSELPADSVAIIPIKGPLMAADQYCGPMGMSTMAKMVASAENSSKIGKIVLEIDSPGGQVKGTQELANAVKACNTPTMAVCNMACSAAYWIASATDEIVATSETVWFGSIGVMIELVNPTAFFKEQGIEFHTIFATLSEDKNRDILEALEGEYELIREKRLDPINAIFHENVRQNRNPSDETLTGHTYLASEAIALGLADKVMSHTLSFNEIIFNNSTNQEITMSTKIPSWLSAVFGSNADKAQELLPPDPEATETEATELTTANTRIAELEAENARLSSEVTRLETENATQQTEIERLGNLPAADHSTVLKDDAPEKMAGTQPTSDEIAKSLDDKFFKSV